MICGIIRNFSFESLVDKFEPKSSYRQRNGISVSGQIKNTNKQNIYVEISGRDTHYLKKHCGEHFDIFFEINDLPYKIQHKSLDYVKQFKLHSLLIAHKKYKEFDDTFNDELADFR